MKKSVAVDDDDSDSDVIFEHDENDDVIVESNSENEEKILKVFIHLSFKTGFFGKKLTVD